MRSFVEHLNHIQREVNALRCRVCQARVRRNKDSKVGLRCPKCGRDYDVAVGPDVADAVMVNDD